MTLDDRYQLHLHADSSQNDMVARALLVAVIGCSCIHAFSPPQYRISHPLRVYLKDPKNARTVGVETSDPLTLLRAPSVAVAAGVTATDNDATTATAAIPPIRRQGYAILVLLFLVTALCALDRVAMSVAILPMSAEFQYTDSTKGLISSVFSLGYMMGLIPSGLLGTFSSPTATLAWGVLLWSLAQISTPFTAHISIPVLLVSSTTN